MSERPADLRDPEHPYWRAHRDVWLAHYDLPALACPYPCACAGRLDLGDVPLECCAHYNTPEKVAKAGRR